VLLKLGARGAFVLDGEREWFAPAFPVSAVDTVAAGDACNAGLAAALCAGLPLAEAVRWGLAAGALAVTRPGAQQAMPTRAELLGLLGQGVDG
jgi:ribokinase